MPESVAWSLIVVLLTALIGSLVFRENQKRDRFIKAADAFRDAFTQAIARLETDPRSYRNILNEEYRVHEEAAIVFRQYLNRHKINKFDKALKDYKEYAIKQADVPITMLFATEVIDINRDKDPAHIKEVAEMRKREFLNHINLLLKFAKPH